mmetsp:Transcript_76902/g.222271  ORF Transcript_76902/g.222271 Transcript_76902/m.222271 type:complete len:296 (-) Transcript_76902:129-1016(-)
MVTERMAWTIAYLLGFLLLLPAKVVVVLAQENLPVLVFNGRIVNDLGQPMEGAQVQFWQTDENGIYKHPRFNMQQGLSLVSHFQYFGTATTANDGSFQFKTYRPGIYSARPIRHIHYKVWINGSDVLTSQFYFADEQGTATQPLLLLLELFQQDDGSLHTNKTIALNMGLGGTEPITPSQTEGPFYPVVDFFHMDSDMTVLTLDEQEEGTLTESPSAMSSTTSGLSQSPSHSPRLVNTGTTTPSPTAATTPSKDSSSSVVDGSSSSSTRNETVLTALLGVALLMLPFYLLIERLP